VLASAAGQPIEPTRQVLGTGERVALGVVANGVGCHQVVQPVVGVTGPGDEVVYLGPGGANP
jgi:hypothetical protein